MPYSITTFSITTLIRTPYSITALSMSTLSMTIKNSELYTRAHK
jgi:hypothetical protein